jgi:hypothetical protein
MTYKLASVIISGGAARLWMCDAKNGARTVTLNSHDDTVAALLGEEWEPFGVGANGALWFRKADPGAGGVLADVADTQEYAPAWETATPAGHQ